jgi:hypothetical protein
VPLLRRVHQFFNARPENVILGVFHVLGVVFFTANTKTSAAPIPIHKLARIAIHVTSIRRA